MLVLGTNSGLCQEEHSGILKHHYAPLSSCSHHAVGSQGKEVDGAKYARSTFSTGHPHCVECFPAAYGVTVYL